MQRFLNARKLLLLLGDIILAYLSLVASVFFGFWRDFNWHIFSEHLLAFSILYFFWVVIFYIFGLYELNLLRGKFDLYARPTTALLVILAISTAFFYSLPLFGITPKSNLVLNIALFGVLAVLWRKFFYFLFSSFFLTRVAIVGKTPEAEDLAGEITRRPYLGYKLVAILDENENLLWQIQEKKIDTLILTETQDLNFRLLQTLYQCLPTKIDFMDFEAAYEFICEKILLAQDRQPWFLKNFERGGKEFYDKIKRMLDVILAGLILLITLPLWPLTALAIKLEDRGTVFYCQQRIGKNRKPFLLRKFRSMSEGAEKSGPVWAKEKDPRITRVGKFLRRSHLDELPQMLNVLKGDLSLVGPRPERPEFVQQLETEIPYYHLRYLIKPGFTGWAQLKFRYARSVIDSGEKLQYDLYYLKNRSLLLDLGILLKTFQLFLRKE